MKKFVKFAIAGTAIAGIGAAVAYFLKKRKENMIFDDECSCDDCDRYDKINDECLCDEDCENCEFAQAGDDSVCGCCCDCEDCLDDPTEEEYGCEDKPEDK